MNCCRALIINLQKVFYNSQASVGDRQYTSLLFISTIFCPQYLTMLMTERGGAIIFCRVWRPNDLPQTKQYLSILHDRERGRHYHFVGFRRPPPPPPPMPSPHDSKYFTILMTEMRDAIIFCRILALFNAFVGFWRPPPLPQTPQYLSIWCSPPGSAWGSCPPSLATACYVSLNYHFKENIY